MKPYLELFVSGFSFFYFCFSLRWGGTVIEEFYFKVEDIVMEQNIPLSHIVLADDDRDHGLLFERTMERVYPSVTLTKILDGEALLQYLNNNTPDLLFLDLNMPLRDGFECLNEIRKNERLQQLPIVVYSSSSDLLDIKRSFLYKANLYMVKPFSTQLLLTALQTVFNMDWLDGDNKTYHYYINNRFVPFTATG